MANKQVKNSATGAMGTGAAKGSRYEKAEVGYGQIKVNSDNPDIILGDTAILSKFPIKELIEGRFVSNAATPDVLEFTPGISFEEATDWTVDKSTTKIDYVLSYIKGTGHPGDGTLGDGVIGPVLKINVLPAAPAVTYPNAATKTATTATLKASIQPQGAETTVSFQYGTTTSYGTTVAAAESPIALGTSVTPVTKAITGLTTATTYHYRAVAVNAGGTTNGADQTFTTD